MDQNKFSNTIEFNDILEVSSKMVGLIRDVMSIDDCIYIGKRIGLVCVKKSYIKELIIRDINKSNFIIFKLPYNKLLIKIFETNKEAKEAYKYYREILNY